MASRAKNPWLISRAQLALAEAMLEGGDAEGALERALEAEASFEHSGQLISEWQALALAARSSRRLKDEAKGREYAALSLQTLSELEKSWGGEAYSNYLARPDVEYLRKQLNEEFALSQ